MNDFNTSNVVVELRRLAQSEGFDVLADAADLLEQVRPWLVWSVDSPGPQWQLNQLLARFDADTRETGEYCDRRRHNFVKFPGGIVATCTYCNRPEPPAQKAGDGKETFAGRGPDDAEFGTAEWRRDQKATVCEWEPIEEGSRCFNTCKPGEEFNLDDGCEPYPFCHWCGRPVELITLNGGCSS